MQRSDPALSRGFDRAELVAGPTRAQPARYVLMLEAGIAARGGIMVREENIVVRKDGATFLSPRLGPKMVCL